MGRPGQVQNCQKPHLASPSRRLTSTSECGIGEPSAADRCIAEIFCASSNWSGRRGCPIGWDFEPYATHEPSGPEVQVDHAAELL